MTVAAALTFTISATGSTAWFRRLGRGVTRITIPGTWVGSLAVEAKTPSGAAVPYRDTGGSAVSFTSNPGVFELTEAGPVRLTFTRTSGTIDAEVWSDESQMETLS